MQIKADEITQLIRQQIENYETRIASMKLARSSPRRRNCPGDGLEKVAPGTALVPARPRGIAMNPRKTRSAWSCSAITPRSEGDQVETHSAIRRARAMDDRPRGEPAGQAIDDKGPISSSQFIPLERLAPGVIERQPVREPMATGLKALIRFHRPRPASWDHRRSPNGQDRIAIDAIINNKGGDLILFIAQSTEAVVHCAGRQILAITAPWITRLWSRRLRPSQRQCNTSRHTRHAPWASTSATPSATRW
jgi:F-type H+-transporting ATPase subunit alpha